MRLVVRAAAASLLAVATAATSALVVPANAEVWDDDGGLVFFGRGYTEPTGYADAFNALDGRTLVQIAGTSEHVCATDEQGEAVCWGESQDGRHGTGARKYPPDGPAAVATTGVLDGKNLVDIDAGDQFSCALDDTGQAYCWGDGRHGQLGSSHGYLAYTPIRVSQRPLPKGVGFVDITTGGQHACGITDEGKAFCWGEGSSGQLGHGNTYDYDIPQRVRPGDLSNRPLVSIDAGDTHTCAVDAAGRAYCWGNGTKGRLGVGYIDNVVATPTRVKGSGPNGVQFADVSAGAAHTCATSIFRRLFCWGSNDHHQVSPKGRRSFIQPRRVDIGQVSSYSTGLEHTCAIVEASYVYCWGSNSEGQIGDGTKDNAKKPTRIKSPGGGLGGTEPELIQALDSMTCGMDAAGDAYCWGRGGTWFQKPTSHDVLTPQRVADQPSGLDGKTLTNLTGAGFGWCMLSSPSQPVCDAENVHTHGIFVSDPVHAIDTGATTTCAVSDAGLAYCWGDEALGVAGLDHSKDPVAVDTSGVLAGRVLVDISVDESHACAVDDKGKAFCWGEDNVGEVGNGPDGPSQVPDNVVSKGVLAGENLIDIETSEYNSCALSDDGDVFCWGFLLGDGTKSISQKPVRTDLSLITPGETVTSLHGANGTPCLLTDAGHAYCWGNAWAGQTGTGYLTFRKVPTPVVRDGVLDGVELTDLAMSDITSMCGLGTNGRIYCWGEDRYGSLGNGPFAGKSDVPVAVVTTGILEGARVTELGAGGGAVWAVAQEAP